MKKRFVLYSLACALAFTLFGCTTYHKVTDPASGRVYYTDSLERLKGGAVRFKDEVTKTWVTLSASEVMQITEDQFKANIHMK